MQSRRLWLVIALPALIVAVALGFQRRDAGPAENASPFLASRAFEDLETIVDFGPRPAGSESLAMTRDYIVAQLGAAGLEPILDRFVGLTPIGPIEMVNIRAIRPGSGEGTIAVAGHYDTKRFDFPFLGANDGGSSAAVVLELARVTEALNLETSLEFVFFDGEEAVRNWTATDSLYGSRHDLDRRYEGGSLDELRALILVDMIGDKDLGILQETASTGWLRNLIWDTARRLGYADHFGSRLSLVEDDHVPYLNAGIAAVDLIDFDYPYWHTTEDTLDKTAPESLKVVGDVIYSVLPQVDTYVTSPH